jgi:antitoxin (DNA-binding transcriptional repressor) of toxin-antitoxin stability system
LDRGGIRAIRPDKLLDGTAECIKPNPMPATKNSDAKPRRRTMQSTMAVEDIKLTLPELIDSLTPGDEVILTRNQKVVAKLVTEQPTPAKSPRPGPGLCKGMITYMAPDFDAPLEDMEEYMQ